MGVFAVLLAVTFFLGLTIALIAYAVKCFIKGPDRYRVASEDVMSGREHATSLSLEEKKQLRTMIDQQSKEQEKKRQHYYEYKRRGHSLPSPYNDPRMPALKTSQHHVDAQQRFEDIEERDHQAKEHSELKKVHLTEQEKEELRKKIPEKASKHSELKGNNLTEEEKEELRKRIRGSFF